MSLFFLSRLRSLLSLPTIHEDARAAEPFRHHGPAVLQQAVRRCRYGAHLLLEETGTGEVSIETAAGVLHCREAGPIRADWRLLPAAHEVDTFHLPVERGPLRDGAALHICNPHAVFFVARLDPQELTLYAPAIQNHPLFPEGINVGATQVIDSKTLRFAVWERPGMLTRACGTGAYSVAHDPSVAAERSLRSGGRGRGNAG